MEQTIATYHFVVTRNSEKENQTFTTSLGEEVAWRGLVNKISMKGVEKIVLATVETEPV